MREECERMSPDWVFLERRTSFFYYFILPKRQCLEITLLHDTTVEHHVYDNLLRFIKITLCYLSRMSIILDREKN